MEAVVELEGVSRRFGDQVALDDVTLTIGRGEFTCVIGPSGAGKTTLLSVINRQLRPTAGRGWVGGMPLHSLRPRELSHLRRKVATVFQDHKLLPELTALENVAFAAQVTDMSLRPSEVRERALQALKAVDMASRPDAFPRQLSYGQCQRVALARAIVTKPLILLADEPTGNLDEKTGKRIVELLVRIGQRGTAVVLATHNNDFVRDLQRRVIKLEQGRLVEDRIPAAAAVKKLRLVEK